MNLLLAILLSVTLWTDSLLFDAYQREDMSVWKEYVDSVTHHQSSITHRTLLYEYGLCGYLADRDKSNALPYVRNFKSHVEQAHSLPYREGTGVGLPAGHYEMYMSAVYVFELRLHESVHPIRAMNLAKEAVRLAPKDPLVLAYYATCLFYAPKPFGSKKEALSYFEKARPFFQTTEYRFCWMRDATDMYIRQCRDKLKR